MHRRTPPLAGDHIPAGFEARLLALFKGLDGFGLILYYWALLGSLIGAIALVAIGFSTWSWWCVLLGLLAIRCYAYVGRIGQSLLDRITPYDG